MSEQANAIKIARVEAHIEGLREQQKANGERSDKRFDGLETKIDELAALMNRGRGAYTASMLIAGAIGAFVLKLCGALMSNFR